MKSLKEFGKEKSSHANLPTEPHISEFPKSPHINSDMDDTITGIDETITRSIGKAKSHPSHQK
jgi:hypothetical protein